MGKLARNIEITILASEWVNCAYNMFHHFRQLVFANNRTMTLYKQYHTQHTLYSQQADLHMCNTVNTSSREIQSKKGDDVGAASHKRLNHI